MICLYIIKFIYALISIMYTICAAIKANENIKNSWTRFPWILVRTVPRIRPRVARLCIWLGERFINNNNNNTIASLDLLKFSYFFIYVFSFCWLSLHNFYENVFGRRSCACSPIKQWKKMAIKENTKNCIDCVFWLEFRFHQLMGLMLR